MVYLRQAPALLSPGVRGPDAKLSTGLKAKYTNATSTRSSLALSLPSTIEAKCCLTSVLE